MRLALSYTLLLAFAAASLADNPRYAQPQPGGALQGKRIYVSPGHGWYYDTTYNAWMPQRDPELGLSEEDAHTLEIASDYLVKYLYNAGATVYVCRERDKQTEEHIVVNSSAAYTETGTWTATSNTGSGYAGGTYRYAAASPTETAVARWTPTLQRAGYYSVYVWYEASANRVTDATFRVNHGGGATEVHMNQQINTSRWLWLGEYWFEAGTAGNVELSNRSAQGGVVIADAVRFGGGMGSLVRGGTTSGKPRYRECARYWLEFLGAPSSVYQTRATDRDSDVTCRPHYADWQGGDAYFALHTNSGGGTGTDTFIYNGVPSPGSAALQRAIHTQVISDIRAQWDSTWTDRGMQTADFGEVRECTTMPAVLLELAFHDMQTPDVDALKDDNFREIAARAFYKGIARYFDANSVILPKAPTDLRVQNLGGGTVRLSWRSALDPLEASATPTGYRVYRSRNGKGFENGVAVASSATDVTYDVTNLAPGQVWYFRVSATNAGGESFPTETLAVRVGPRSQVLIVDAFDRVDATVTCRDGLNTFDYVRQHAQAIAATGANGGQVVFDSSTRQAVADGLVTLSSYDAVDWVSGRNGTTKYRTFTSTEQTALRSYVSGGGALLVTGDEVASDLTNNGGGAFLADVLHSTYVSGSSPAPSVDGVAGSAFAGLTALQYGGAQGAYPVPSVDEVSASGGATAALSQGTGVQFAGANRVLYLTIPFESFAAANQNQVMGDALSFLIQHPVSTQKELIVGLGAGAQGRFAQVDLTRSVVERWGTIPWSAYDASVGETRIACGDVDGDGLDDFVVGLGRYPAAGGYVEVIGDARTGYAHLAWLRYNYPAYDAANGETWVACGDVDGDGKADIIVGPGPYGPAGGWVEVFGDAATGYRSLTWLHVPDSSYDAADGRAYPACGKVADGNACQIVLGLGPSTASGGRVFVFDHAPGYALLGTVTMPWSTYDARCGETRPALADLDGDGRAEMLVATGSFPLAGGWVWVCDDAAAHYATRGWTHLDWPAYDAADGQVWAAAGDANGDGTVKVVLGMGRWPTSSGPYVQVRGGLSSNFASQGWLGLGWGAYDAANGTTRPAFGQVR